MGFFDFVINMVKDYQEFKKQLEFENSPRGKALKAKQEKRVENITKFTKYLIQKIRNSYNRGDEKCNLNALLLTTYNNYHETLSYQEATSEMREEALKLALNELGFSEDKIKDGVLYF